MREQAKGSLLTDRRVLFAVTFAASFAAFLGPLGAYDVWWHLKAGRLILAGGGVPTADPFSFTAAGQPWTYHSWLSGLIMTGLWAAGGTVALILMRALLLSASMMLAWVAARQRGVAASVASILVLAGALQLKMRALARPYLFSFVLFIAFALIVQAAFARPLPALARRIRATARGRRWLALEDAFLWGEGGRLLALPLLMVLWANLHAGFISGILVLGAYGVGEILNVCARGGWRSWPAVLLRGPAGARFRALFVVGILCVAASVVTPGGPATFTYPFRLMQGVKLVKRIREWQPVPLTAQFAVFWAFVGLSAVILVRSVASSARAGRLRGEAGQAVTDLLLMGGFTVLAVQAARHMAWLLLLAPAVLGWHLNLRRLSPLERRAAAAAAPPPESVCALAAYVLALAVGVWPFVTGGWPSFGPVRDKFPVAACGFMEQQRLDYPFYNSYEWGGYLIWRLWPRQAVFIDGRCLVYGDRIIGQAIEVEDGGPSWERILDEHGVRMLLVNWRKKDASHLFRTRRWRCVYWDDTAVIGLREDVLAEHRPALPELRHSNPAGFEEAPGTARADQALAELAVVLSRAPTCWTALGYRARCLVRLAKERPQERGDLLAAALEAARMAVELMPDHFEPWEALEEVAREGGQGELAATAGRAAARLRARLGEDDAL